MKYSKLFSKQKRCKFWSMYIRRRNAIKPFLEVKNFEDFCKVLINSGFNKY